MGIVDAVLVRALLGYDLPAVASALATAARLGIPVTWTQNEVLRALLDQQLPSGAFGGLVEVDQRRSFGESVATTAGVVDGLRRFLLQPSRSALVRTGN